MAPCHSHRPTLRDTRQQGPRARLIPGNIQSSVMGSPRWRVHEMYGDHAGRPPVGLD